MKKSIAEYGCSHMVTMKYIVVDTGLNDCIVIFPNQFNHSDISLPGTLLSAGFIEWDDHRGWVCFGKSVSLECKSRPEDSALANRQLPSLR